MDKNTKRFLREAARELIERNAPAIAGVTQDAERLGKDPVEEVEEYVMGYLVGCLHDGLRRPGSWEAQWAQMAGLA